MDYSAIKSTLKNTFEVEIVHPKTGEGGWIWELASPHHAAAQARVNEVLDRSNKRKFTTTAQSEKDGVDLIMARVISWRGLENEGQPVPYSDELALAILSERESFWVRSQLVEALGDVSKPFKN